MFEKFALFLLEYQNAFESIDHIFILGYADDIEKLMLKLHDGSRNAILRINESKGRGRV